MPFCKEGHKLQNYKVSNTGVIWDSKPKYGLRNYRWGKEYFNILTSDNHKEPNVMEYIVKYNNALEKKQYNNRWSYIKNLKEITVNNI